MRRRPPGSTPAKPPRPERPLFRSEGGFVNSFNPRTREGCDLPGTVSRRHALFQSTHPRGVRPSINPRCGIMDCFNPRTREGCDAFLTTSQASTMFQSTHPRGVRPDANRLASTIKRFNPRTREGCDDSSVMLHLVMDVSIHAPARGATFPFYKYAMEFEVSIHAPARGATWVPPTLEI